MNNLARQKGNIPIDRIDRMIFVVRGHKVMIDNDLAELYGVQTKVLNQSVKRNIQRFPDDFMFQFIPEEAEALRSQTVTLEVGRGKYRKYLPYVFTEQGVAMLSTVLSSPRAISVNIEIMRTFVRLRQAFASYQELTKAMTELRSFVLKDSAKTRQEIRRIWDVIEKMIIPADDNKTRRIGFSLD